MTASPDKIRNPGITGRKSDNQDSDDDFKAKKKEVKFDDMFKNINEDNFESSDDGEEKQKNKRLENLAKVSQPTVVNKQKEEEQKAKLSQDDEDPQENTNNIIIGENTDILARYRIPIEKNDIDYKL